MNQCHHGYVAVLPDRRVVSLDTNNPHNNLVELSRESCRSPNSSPWDPIKTRLFSKSQQRYLCFNRRGRVRSVTPRRAELMGDLCAFYDRAEASPRHVDHAHPNPPTSYITLQSARNPKWYLGFGPNTPRARRNLGLNYYKGHALSLPRKMKRGRVRHLKKCDFRFVSGIFTPYDTPTKSHPSWEGLFKQIQDSHGSLVLTNEVESTSSTPLEGVESKRPHPKKKGVSSSTNTPVNVRSKISQRASFTLQQLLRRNGNHSPSPRISTP